MTTNRTTGVMAISVSATSRGLVLFSTQVRGIKFYGVPINLIHVGSSVSLCLEPFHPHDSNCIALWMGSAMLGHLTRETACDLVPLLWHGVMASGYVSNMIQ